MGRIGFNRRRKTSATPERIDLEGTTSSHKGFAGFFESMLRKFKTVMHAALTMPLYFISCLALGLALTPGILLFQYADPYYQDLSPWLHYLLRGVLFALAYFIYGFSLLLVAPAFNFLFQISLKEWRGPYYSLMSIRWFMHNGLTYLARYTFLEFVTPTPFSLWFYRGMGMKIGRGVTINTTGISDPSLIEMGDKVTVGGSVFIVGHYGQGGFLVLAPVKIGHGVTLGLRSSVMGGVVIGDGAKILPHSVVLPKTVIPAGETWGGIPARKIDPKELAQKVA